MGWGIHYSEDGHVIFVDSDNARRVDVAPHHAEIVSFGLNRLFDPRRKTYDVTIPTTDGGEFEMTIPPAMVPGFIIDLQEMANLARKAVGQKFH